MAESGTGMCRAASQTGGLTEPRSQSPAALLTLTEASNQQSRTRQYPETVPHPNPSPKESGASGGS
ncbi:hypothetical protein XHV734_2311 [Xanthomonas hortorum pv. vitians]|nr:hypothetical protein XHV734_2311 [Xanthomonas hortorum pv. vitians]